MCALWKSRDRGIVSVAIASLVRSLFAWLGDGAAPRGSCSAAVGYLRNPLGVVVTGQVAVVRTLSSSERSVGRCPAAARALFQGTGRGQSGSSADTPARIDMMDRAEPRQYSPAGRGLRCTARETTLRRRRNCQRPRPSPCPGPSDTRDDSGRKVVAIARLRRVRGAWLRRKRDLKSQMNYEEI